MPQEQKQASTKGPAPSLEETREKKGALPSGPSSTPTKKSTTFAPKDLTGTSGGFVITGVDGHKKK